MMANNCESTNKRVGLLIKFICVSTMVRRTQRGGKKKSFNLLICNIISVVSVVWF